MKYVILTLTLALILGLAIVFLTAQTPETNETATNNLFITDFAEALNISKVTQKPILIDFTGSDWCGWCIKLDEEVFSQPEFIEYATNNLVLFKADYPSKNVVQSDELKAQNATLLKKYEIEGFPTIMLIDADENILAETGYQFGGAASYVEHLKELLQ